MKIGIAALLAVAGLGVVNHMAFGQGDGADNQLHPFSFLENLSLVVMPDGHAMKRLITDPAMSGMILKHAKPMKAGMIIFMHDGKIFMAKDEKMEDGKMLSADIMHPSK